MADVSQYAAERRAELGLPPDPVSDAKWERWIREGSRSLDDMEFRLTDKAIQEGTINGWSGATGDADARRDNPVFQQPDPVTTGRAPTPAPAAPTTAELAQQQREATRGAMRAMLGWLPESLLNAYINEWVNHGDGELAWAKVRTLPEYDIHFPGIKRDDGSLRMAEQDYLSHREGFNRELMQFGLNPGLFAGHHANLVRGDVSVGEIRQRIQAKVTGVVQNLPEVRAKFGQFYGVNAMSDQALIAAALDPQIGLDLLQGRIQASQVAGEAALQGFQRDRGRAERLTFAGGLDQQAARQLFTQAARVVPQTQRFVDRFNDPFGEFGVEQFEDASVFGDTDEQRRRERLVASERALFNRGGQVRRDNTGLGGLSPR